MVNVCSFIGLMALELREAMCGCVVDVAFLAASPLVVPRLKCETGRGSFRGDDWVCNACTRRTGRGAQGRAGQHKMDGARLVGTTTSARFAKRNMAVGKMKHVTAALVWAFTQCATISKKNDFPKIHDIGPLKDDMGSQSKQDTVQSLQCSRNAAMDMMTAVNTAPETPSAMTAKRT